MLPNTNSIVSITNFICRILFIFINYYPNEQIIQKNHDAEFYCQVFLNNLLPLFFVFLYVSYPQVINYYLNQLFSNHSFLIINDKNLFTT